MNYPIFFDVGGDNFDKFLLNYKENPVRSCELPPKKINNKILRVIILAVDFTLKNFSEAEGYFGWLAQGRVNDEVLKKLRDDTSKYIKTKKENEVICILWACHFPPVFPSISSLSKLISEKKLIKEANELKVSAILAGHTHEQVIYNSPLLRSTVLCCGTTTQYCPESDTEQENFFQMISITLDKNDLIILKIAPYKCIPNQRGIYLMKQQISPVQFKWQKVQSSPHLLF